MDILNFKNCEDVKMESFPFKGKVRPVVGVSIRWLSKFGDDGTGHPEYGLRYFTVQPGGEIPVHSHFYHQTMYILSGKFECYQYSMETEEVVYKKVTNKDDFIYVPSLEPHGMKNISDELGAFICCIANIYSDEPE